MCVTLEKLKFLGFTDIYALDVKWEKSVQKLADEKYIYITTYHACSAQMGSTSVTYTTAPSPLRAWQHPLPTSP